MNLPTEPERWRCRVAYVGTSFSGWQSQPDGNAVQDHLERAFARLADKQLRIHGSGRTDSGVHARGQVFHVDLAWRHGPDRLVAALRTMTPAAIQVQTAQRVPNTFHARFDALGKIYHYQLHPGGWADPFADPFCWSLPKPLDETAMRAAAAHLVGRHDFRAFSASRRDDSDDADTVRNLRRLELVADSAIWRIEAEGEGFLYKMVRGLTGALVHVGLGKLSPDEIITIRDAATRTGQVETAPAQGLCLMEVHYP